MSRLVLRLRASPRRAPAAGASRNDFKRKAARRPRYSSFFLQQYALSGTCLPDSRSGCCAERSSSCGLAFELMWTKARMQASTGECGDSKSRLVLRLRASPRRAPAAGASRVQMISGVKLQHGPNIRVSSCRSRPCLALAMLFSCTISNAACTSLL